MTEHTTRTATNGRICDTVIDAVSAATNTDPLDLPQLYDTIDPDALERLFCGGDGDARPRGRIEFAFADCDVRVHADGRVVVVPSRTEAPTRTVSTA